jgi:hypothetical protein
MNESNAVTFVNVEDFAHRYILAAFGVFDAGIHLACCRSQSALRATLRVMDQVGGFFRRTTELS